MNMKEIRITSDGLPQNTFVTHIATGIQIPCKRVIIDISADPKDESIVILEVSAAQVEFDVNGARAKLNTIHNHEVLKDFERVS